MSGAATRWTPKYWQLVEQFRKQIDVGQLKPGDRLPSYTEMRVEYGASRPTTEKMHGILEREGYIVREPGRGTFVAPARQPARTSTIGFAGYVPNSGNHPYFVHLLDGVHQAAVQDGMEVLLVGQPADVAWEKLDGIVIVSMDPEAWLQRLPPGMPHVVLLNDVADASHVVTDDQDGTLQATKHLLDLGHRRIGYLISGPEQPLSMRRLAGYRGAMRLAGIKGQANWIYEIPRYKGPQYIERGRLGMLDWLANGFEKLGLTAILVQNDDAAMGAIQALRENNIRVPEDISVVGFDGTEVSQYASPPLTTVQLPLQELGTRATEMLLQRMKSSDELPVEHVALPAKLIVRESTAPPPEGK